MTSIQFCVSYQKVFKSALYCLLLHEELPVHIYVVSFDFVFFCILCMHNVFFGVFYILLCVLHQAGVAEELPVLVSVLLYSFVF